MHRILPLKKALRIFGIAALAFTSYQSTAQTVTLFRSGVIVPPTFTSISAAISAAMPNDSLVLSAHTFNEHNILIDKDIKLRGTIDSMRQSTIDAQLMGRAILINDGKVEINSITIKNGKLANAYGAGICSYSTLPFTLSGSAIVEHCRAEGSLGLGGGIYAAGRLNLYDSVEVRNNYCETEGGGVYAYSTFVMDAKARLVNNKADGSGGGVFASANGACQLRGHAEISGNEAKESGGGVFGVGTFQGHAKIYNNKAKSGAGVAAFNDVLILQDSVNINYNIATDFGAGIWLNNCTVYGSGAFHILGNQIVVDTTKTTQFGSAIYNVNGNLYFTGGVIKANKGSMAAIYNTAALSSTVKVNNAILYNPKADGSRIYEVYNSPSLSTSTINFDGSYCWWGHNDTTNLVSQKAGTPKGVINSYIINLWKLNKGMPISPDSSHFIVEARFYLQDTTKMDSTVLRNINGYFMASNGTFAPSRNYIDSMNVVASNYTAPMASDSINIIAYVDGDTFKVSKIAVKGLSIANKNLAQQILVYPNPSQSHIEIANLKAGTNIQLLNLNGQSLYNMISNNTIEQLNLQNLPNANYILMLRYPDGTKASTMITKN